VSTTFFNANPELNLRARCKALWEAGDFGVVARHNEPAAAEFMARPHLPLGPGVRVLDLACGTGNLAIHAARAGCVTSGLDLAANLVAQARARAQAQGLSIEFTEGDAEALPYANGAFDLLVSMYGVMFAPHPEKVVSELARVCRPGGMLALANWTAEGFIGENFQVVGRHIQPRSDAPSPLLWGDEAVVRARLAGCVSDLHFNRRIARLRYPFAPAQTVDFFRQFYGPTLRAFDSLDAAAQSRLHRDLEEMFHRNNRATGNVTEVDAEYLEVVAIRC
jgi:SAM-dependent methyltransferase